MFVMDMLLLNFVWFCCFCYFVVDFYLGTIEFVSSPNIKIITTIDSCYSVNIVEHWIPCADSTRQNKK